MGNLAAVYLASESVLHFTNDARIRDFTEDRLRHFADVRCFHNSHAPDHSTCGTSTSLMPIAPGTKSAFKSYPGGKNGAGVYKNLISLMPPHDTYVEAFLGSGAVMRHKRPASCSIAIERDEDVLSRWSGQEVPNLTLMLGDAITILRGWRFTLPVRTDRETMRRTLLYLDPPYLLSTRRQHRPIYRYDFASEAEHRELLEVLMNLPCMVMLSGYCSELYDKALAHWRRAEFHTSNRAGQRTLECVWMNYAEPLELHDYRFLGQGFRERERIKRKRQRWRARLEGMPALERHALMATIEELRLDRS
jgi:DNA adenine methylase